MKKLIAVLCLVILCACDETKSAPAGAQPQPAEKTARVKEPLPTNGEKFWEAPMPPCFHEEYPPIECEHIASKTVYMYSNDKNHWYFEAYTQTDDEKIYQCAERCDDGECGQKNLGVIIEQPSSGKIFMRPNPDNQLVDGEEFKKTILFHKFGENDYRFGCCLFKDHQYISFDRQKQTATWEMEGSSVNCYNVSATGYVTKEMLIGTWIYESDDGNPDFVKVYKFNSDNTGEWHFFNGVFSITEYSVKDATLTYTDIAAKGWDSLRNTPLTQAFRLEYVSNDEFVMINERGGKWNYKRKKPEEAKPKSD